MSEHEERLATDDLLAVRGTIVHCTSDPRDAGEREALEAWEDGALVMRAGRIEAAGAAAEVLAALPRGTPVHDHRGKLVVPGFVDCHVHYPQTEIIASHGERLLEWLERYTFPAERRFEERAHADDIAALFLDELLANGTTTALVFGTVHAHSADAIFEAAQARGMRLAAGKVLMDRNCPEWLRDSAESGYRDSRALIERWHKVARLEYAITPRFAPTSTREQLALAGQLAGEFPDVFVHTHVAENPAEVAWVAELFPEARSYLDVYDRFGLLRPRSVYAHCIHLDEADRSRMAEAGASIAFCPTSNLFLGSGLLDLEASRGIRVGAATDVGGGTSLSMLRTLAEGYKVAQLRGQTLSPASLLYLGTLGAARALYQDAAIGSFEPGKEADFVVLDPRASRLMARRAGRAESLEELWFMLVMLGDDRAVAQTYVAGRPVLAAASS